MPLPASELNGASSRSRVPLTETEGVYFEDRVALVASTI